jgi:hypothetical protein
LASSLTITRSFCRQYGEVLQKLKALNGRHCFEDPQFSGPFFTVNKMRTLSQPQQIKGNVWDVSTKDFVCYRPGRVAGGGMSRELRWFDTDTPLPILEQLGNLELFKGGKSFKFKNAIAGPTPTDNYMDQSALMPNVENPSDHMMVVSIIPLMAREVEGGETSGQPAAIEG